MWVSPDEQKAGKNSYENKIQLDPAGCSQPSLAASRIICSGSAGSFMIF